MQETAVARLDELTDGQIKKAKAGDTALLLARVGDTVYAVGAVCPHYQAPLADGLLCGHRLYCPWHHSSFDVRGGELLDPPSPDGLPTYPVRLEAGQIFVTLPNAELPVITEPEAHATDTDYRTIVILGGGAAGFFAAQTLRQQGFTGRVVLLSREAELPYDRAKLSKNFLDGRATADKVPMRGEEFYEQHRIEVQTHADVKTVDPAARTITFTDGDVMHYAVLIAATGSDARPLDVPGYDLPGVFTLRSFADSQRIIDQLTSAKRAVVVGGSFIGLEVAASLRKRGLDVTVVTKEDALYAKILGPEIGAMFQQLHEANGVQFRLGSNVRAITGNETVEAVVLESGETLPADLVVAGVGVTPNTAWLTGISLAEKDHSIPVDTYLRAAPDLFATGDIARFPDPHNHDVPTRIEHWRTAQQHGTVAALNALGQETSLAESVPFFWTNQYEKRLSYVGHADEWDDIIIHGDVPEQKFMAFYAKDDQILAVASMQHDRESIAVEELMRRGRMPAAASVRQELPDLVALVSPT